MMKNVYFLRVFFEKFKPHILIILTEFGYTFLYFFTDASFKHGMNPHIHVTYRQIVATIALFPFAYFLERSSLSQNMYYSSMRYTSPTFLSSMVNTIACLTFIIAVMFKFSSLDFHELKNY
ncbi:WAT1-related protein, partial [Cucurbita argyrosperma subsp. argyrosperma]